MAVFQANIIPVVAKFNFDSNDGTFRMRVSTQVKRPDGTRYEADIEVSADLGALVTTLFQLWTLGGNLDAPVTAMALPSAVVVPTADDATFGGIVSGGVFGDVGTANSADDLVDSDLV